MINSILNNVLFSHANHSPHVHSGDGILVIIIPMVIAGILLMRYVTKGEK